MAILAMRQEPIGLDIGKSSIVGVQLGGKSPMLSLAAVHELSLIHISEPTRLLSISYAVFCLKKKKLTRGR